MRHQAASLCPDVLMGILDLLTGGQASMLPKGGNPLYEYTNGRGFVEGMPRFDEWGLIPKGHVGPRDNPLVVVPSASGPGAAMSAAPAEGRAEPSVVCPLAPTLPHEGEVPSVGPSAARDARSCAPSPRGAASGIPACRKRGQTESGADSSLQSLKRRKWVATDE